MRRFKRPSLLIGQKPKEETMKIPDAPVVPTSNMRLPNARNAPMGAVGGPGGLSGAPNMAQAQMMGGKGPMQPFEKQTPSVEDVWQGTAGFGEGLQPGRDIKDIADEVERDVDQAGVGGGARDSPPNMAPGETPFDDYQTNDALAEQAIAELLGGGVRDTSEDEALIRELLAGTVGQGQADLNARLAAGGFGTSGALGALSGDMRANAARKSAQEIMGVRQSARDEWLERTMAGIEAEFKDRGLDLSDEQFQSYVDMLKEMAANDEAAAEEERQSKLPDSSAIKGAKPSVQQPWGSRYIGEDDNWTYYRTVWGDIAKVPKSGKVNAEGEAVE